MALMTLAGPAVAEPTCLMVGGTCVGAANTVAVVLQRAMPVDLEGSTLMYAMTDGWSVVVGTNSKGSDAASAWLCGQEAARLYLRGGGRIEVMVGDVTTFDLMTCEAP
ncbi:MAG: hypothetical protein ACT4OK_11775 [Gemmobacter sp.]